MKNCEKCKHYHRDQIFEWCRANAFAPHYDDLGRWIEQSHGTAWAARRDDSKCGGAGKWFEPKPPPNVDSTSTPRPWWQFWGKR